MNMERKLNNPIFYCIFLYTIILSCPLIVIENTLMTTGEQYYKRLIEPIEQQMMSVIARIIHNNDEAMDVFHSVLATIWAKLGRIDQHSNPHAYILRICITHAYDALRAAKSRRYHESIAVLRRHDMSSDKEVTTDSDERVLQLINDAICELPHRQAKSFLLRVVQDISFQEIANVLDCSEPTARSHFSKAKAKIRDRLTRRGVLKTCGSKGNEHE
jgi:RNA polymerase sigma-70 factor, ECF subfamily